ncbi:MAG: dCMP deaminase family protein [Candidatus Latescibacteria bacterium]|nr:dCMP deaminase family protein [Candidatus Latescibacterota bacterium]
MFNRVIFLYIFYQEFKPENYRILKNRPDKDHYYLNIAREVARRSTCLRRWFGAVIVKNDQIISTGYAGAARGAKNCSDLGYCPRQQAGIPHGERYELCRSVHAEMNAIIHAARTDMIDSTLYLVGLEADTQEIVKGGKPCKICTRLIINAGIKTVKILDDKTNVITYEVEDFIKNEQLDLKNVQGY